MTAYFKLSTNALIPVLSEGSLVLYGSAAICLICAYPQAKLAPVVGTVERAHFYKWLMRLTNTLQAALIVCVYPRRCINEGSSDTNNNALSISEAARPLLNQGMPNHGRWTRYFVAATRVGPACSGPGDGR